MSGGTVTGTPYIGSKISLVSKAEIRYEGFLYTIDTKHTTVTLSNVRSYGTENRDAPKFISPRNEVYEYIVFRGADIKDLNVSEGPKPNLPDDPAIITSGQGGAPGPSQTYSQFPTGRTNYPPTSRYNAFGGLPPYGSYPMGFQQQPSFADPHMPPMHPAAQMPSGSMIPPRIPTPPVQSLSRSNTPSPETVTPIGPPKASDLKTQETQTKVTSQAGTQTSQHKKKSSNKPSSRRNSLDDGAQVSQRSNKPNTKEAGDMETNRKQVPVESDQRSREGSSRRPRGRRGGGHFSGRGSRQGAPIKFEGDFDFESSNARFKKEEIEEELHNKLGLTLNISEGEDKREPSVSADTKDLLEATSPTTVYYDKGKSFFDSISCEANDRDKNRKAHPSWVEERKLNVETFGISGGMRHGGGRGRGGRGGRGSYRGRGGRGGGRGGRGRGGWRGGSRGYRGGGRPNRGWVDYPLEFDADSVRSDTSNTSATNGPSGQTIPSSAKA